jgi:hypothetical protein
MNGLTTLNPSFHPTSACPRCQGLRLLDNYYDHHESSAPSWIYSLRCLNCGFVEDPVIFKNRRLTDLPTPRRQLPGNKTGAKPLLRKRSGNTFTDYKNDPDTLSR